MSNIDQIALDLIELTRYLHEQCGYEISGGFLGGQYGYGPLLIENNLFVFKSYCWCEADGCPWCGVCSCPESAFTYFVDDKQVGVDEYEAFCEKSYEEIPGSSTALSSAELDRRTLVEHIPTCTTCLGTDDVARMGGGPSKAAPNFWHKPSDIKISWYKYIGRSMQMEGPTDQWPAALSEIYERMQIIELGHQGRVASPSQPGSLDEPADAE